MVIQGIRDAAQDDEHLQALTTDIVRGLPFIKAKVRQGVQPYWTFCDDLVEVDRVALKDRSLVTPASFQQQAFKKLHSNQMGIETHIYLRMSPYNG